MTEASVTQGLLSHLKQALPGAVIFKLSDRLTKGVPDISVAWNGYTTWLEVKLLRRGESLESRLLDPGDSLQRVRMKQLHQQSGGRAWYVVYDSRDTRRKRVAIYAPHAVDREESLEFDNCTALVNGFDHQAVVRLIETL